MAAVSLACFQRAELLYRTDATPLGPDGLPPPISDNKEVVAHLQQTLDDDPQRAVHEAAAAAIISRRSRRALRALRAAHVEERYTRYVCYACRTRCVRYMRSMQSHAFHASHALHASRALHRKSPSWPLLKVDRWRLRRALSLSGNSTADTAAKRAAEAKKAKQVPWLLQHGDLPKAQADNLPHVSARMVHDIYLAKRAEGMAAGPGLP